MGHLRPYARGLATTEAGGGSDANGAKADIAVGRSGAEGRTDVLGAPPSASIDAIRKHLESVGFLRRTELIEGTTNLRG